MSVVIGAPLYVMEKESAEMLPGEETTSPLAVTMSTGVSEAAFGVAPLTERLVNRAVPKSAMVCCWPLADEGASSIHSAEVWGPSYATDSVTPCFDVRSTMAIDHVPGASSTMVALI